MRPNRPTDPARGFVEALQQKYASEVPTRNDEPGTTAAAQPLNKPISWGGKVVEEVGFEKVRQQQALLQQLHVVLLDGCRVVGLMGNAVAGDEDQQRNAEEDIRETCPNIVELDLSRNLLERWEDVAKICRQLKRLKSLRLKYGATLNMVVGKGRCMLI